ncbi:hypothetical protein [Bacillus sp. FJAT-27445]|uniref:hypothetical protein n=1 Tax=Bacillus sp. FJAT-27445 TaxID=1679166 RepID=UPI0007433219|nr:hypothetical protein [Bacillus sp. FJAT-27445]
MNSELFNEYIATLATAKGVIVDYRGYPADFQMNVSLKSYLIDSTVKSPIILVPKIFYLDQEKVDFENVQWPIELASPKFTGKMFFNISGCNEYAGNNPGYCKSIQTQ